MGLKLVAPGRDGSIMIFGVNMLVSLNTAVMIQYIDGPAPVLMLIDFGGSCL